MKKTYIVLSRSNTIVALLVRFFTHKYYNHTSLAFTPDLDNFYSFGRKNPRRLLPAGFISEGVHTGYFGMKPQTKILVFEAELDESEYRLLNRHLSEFKRKREEYEYNIMGLPVALFGIPWHRAHKYTCSSFVAYCFRDILKFDKHYSLTQPEDFYKFNFTKIYEGTAGDYHYEKQQIQC